MYRDSCDHDAHVSARMCVLQTGLSIMWLLTLFIIIICKCISNFRARPGYAAHFVCGIHFLKFCQMKFTCMTWYFSFFFFFSFHQVIAFNVTCRFHMFRYDVAPYNFAYFEVDNAQLME